MNDVLTQKRLSGVPALTRRPCPPIMSVAGGATVEHGGRCAVARAPLPALLMVGKLDEGKNLEHVREVVKTR